MNAGPEILTGPYYARLEQLEQQHWWCRSVRRVALAWLSEVLDEGALVLDAGCGAGGFLESLTTRRPSHRAVGSDLSAEALLLARDRGLRRLLQASMMELPVAAGRMDAVLLHDVLQHLPPGGDAIALAEARRVLKPGGALSLRSNFGRRLEIGATALHRRYDRRALAALVRASGFRIERHFVLHPLAALLGRSHSPHAPGHGQEAGGLTVRMPPAPVNLLMDFYSRVEDAVVRRFRFVSSLGDTQIIFGRKAAQEGAEAKPASP